MILSSRRERRNEFGQAEVFREMFRRLLRTLLPEVREVALVFPARVEPLARTRCETCCAGVRVRRIRRARVSKPQQTLRSRLRRSRRRDPATASGGRVLEKERFLRRQG